KCFGLGVATSRARTGPLVRLLAGTDPWIVLTHCPPTYVTMGDEKDAWCPELGCRALEPVLLRRRPNLVIHGHIHKGIPEADLRPKFDRLDDFGDHATPLRVYNVAYPVRRSIATFDL